MSCASITVQVHEDADHLARLLASLEAAPAWRVHPVLVLDNSCTASARTAVARATGNASQLRIRLVDAELWTAARTQIAIKLKSELSGRSAAMVATIALGKPGWNAHFGRMAGMILTRALFPDATRTLHLDADIVIPLGLRSALSELPPFCGYRIDGCPDLSRLEWIDLATLACLPRKAFAAPSYTERLRETLAGHALDTIFASYTDLMPVQVIRPSLAGLPPREEFHGAAYVLDPGRFGESPVGEWYDNDWTFFEMIGGPASVRPQLQESLLHLSRRKTVLSMEALAIEEKGKALHAAALDRGEDEARLLRAAAHRQREVSAVAARLVAAGSSLEERYGSQTARKMRSAVSRLAAFVTDGAVSKLAPSLARFRSMAEAWPHLIKAAHAIGPTILPFE